MRSREICKIAINVMGKQTSCLHIQGRSEEDGRGGAADSSETFVPVHHIMKASHPEDSNLNKGYTNPGLLNSVRWYPTFVGLQ